MTYFPASIWRRTACAAALGAAALAQPALAQSLVLYDDFSGSSLSGSKWLGEEGRQAGALRLDVRRNILNGQLRLETRDAGDNVRNEGSSTARQSVIFAKSYAVTAMKATVTMRSYKLGACTTNTGTPGSARARLVGNFFNAGTPIPNSSMNDTIAGLQIYRNTGSQDAADTFRVLGFIATCTDDACANSKSIASVELLSGVALNTPVPMTVSWDKSANTFTYTAAAVTKTLTYTLKDKEAPATNSKRLEVFNVLQQCEGSRVIVASGADFDDVYVNSQALP